jgi:hypothetical protein
MTTRRWRNEHDIVELKMQETWDIGELVLSVSKKSKLILKRRV